MKTKLSFLALPSFCLGIVLTIVLAACTSDSTDSGGGESASSSKSSGSTEPPGPVKGSLEISDLGVEVRKSGDKADLTGLVKGNSTTRILKIEFNLDKSANNWLYDLDGNKSVNTNLTFDDPGVVSHPLSNYYIDLTSISCGTIKFWVKACTDKDCKDSPTTSPPVEFEKGCAASSSSESAPSSSSEEKKWKFGSPTTVEIKSPDELVKINSSVSFKFVGEEEIIDTQPNLEVDGGKVRYANSLCVDEKVVPGKSYEVKDPKTGMECLGNSVPSKSKYDEGVNEDDMFIIYSGDEKWLLLFQRGGDKWRMWPKKCTYWPATESPE